MQAKRGQENSWIWTASKWASTWDVWLILPESHIIIPLNQVRIFEVLDVGVFIVPIYFRCTFSTIQHRHQNYVDTASLKCVLLEKRNQVGRKANEMEIKIIQGSISNANVVVVPATTKDKCCHYVMKTENGKKSSINAIPMVTPFYDGQWMVFYGLLSLLVLGQKQC